MEATTAASPPGSPTGRTVPGSPSLLPPASPVSSGSAFPTSGGLSGALTTTTAPASGPSPTTALSATATTGNNALSTGVNGGTQSNLMNGAGGMGMDPYGSGMMSDPYGYGGGMGGMYGGMGGMYGGMGGMYGGMGGMGMMGMGMPGMMGMGMYGMTPDAQRGQMMMMMISSMVQLWGMFSQVVQGTFGSMIQFVGNYVGINQRLGQIREEGMGQEEQFFHREYETKQALLELPESDRVSTKQVRQRRHRHFQRQKPQGSTMRSIMLRLLRHLALIVVAYFVATRLGRLWARKPTKQLQS